MLRKLQALCPALPAGAGAFCFPAALRALHLLYDNVDHDLTPDQLTLPRFGYLVTLKALLTEMESKLDTLDATTKECHDICLNTDKEDIAHDQD